MKSSHFLDNETVLSSTSIRHLPLGKMHFSGEKKSIVITHQEFAAFVNSLKENANKDAATMAQNAIAKLGPDANAIDLIYAILTSHKYRKSKKSFLPEAPTKKKIQEAMAKQMPIELVIPLFPCKVPNKLKSESLSPDLAEILCLLRLFEICKAIEAVYSPGGRITIALDGMRFKEAWNMPQTFITNYQLELQKLVDFMKINEVITLVDYVKTLEEGLSHEQKSQRELNKKLAEEEYAEFSEKIVQLAGKNYQKRLELALNLDPDKDNANTFGRFVPLFQSTMYSIYLPEIYENPNSHELTLGVFSKIYDIADPIYGPMRKTILEQTWNATLKYIVAVRTDRDVDLLSKIFPNAIRCTIHSKPGQLGLTTINKRTKIESWHGTGYMASDHKMGADFKISLETEGFVAVFVEKDKQPMFYTKILKI